MSSSKQSEELAAKTHHATPKMVNNVFLDFLMQEIILILNVCRFKFYFRIQIQTKKVNSR